MTEQLIYKRFDIAVTQANERIKENFELDKTARYIKGLLLTSDRDDLLYFRGEQGIEVNGQEIFPENYESKLLLSGLNVEPDRRFYSMEDMEPGNGIITVQYQDKDHAQAAFEPYRVSVYVAYLTDDL